MLYFNSSDALYTVHLVSLMFTISDYQMEKRVYIIPNLYNFDHVNTSIIKIKGFLHIDLLYF